MAEKYYVWFSEDEIKNFAVACEDMDVDFEVVETVDMGDEIFYQVRVETVEEVYEALISNIGYDLED